MGSLKSIADKKNCGSGSNINTGTKGCQVEFKTPEHVLSVDKSFKMLASDVLTPAYLTPLIQKDTVTPLIGASAFERLSSEDTSSTNSSGQERINLLGLPKYKLTFEEGHEFYKNMSKMTSYKSRDFIIIDEDGNWRVANSITGDYEGFTAGQVVAEMTTEKIKGGDAESKSLTIQFLNRRQWDLNYSILSAELLGFLPEDIPTINTVNLEFNNIPGNGDTVIDINATLSDRATALEGLIVSNFLVKINGSTVTPSAIAEATPGNYQLTLAALSTNDIVELVTFDSTLNTTATVSNEIIYRAESISEVTV